MVFHVLPPVQAPGQALKQVRAAREQLMYFEVFFFFFFFDSTSFIEQCEPSKGIGGKKPCTDSSIGSCVRACVTDARATVYVCVHMPKEMYEKEKMCMHAAEEADSSAEKEYCSLC